MNGTAKVLAKTDPKTAHNPLVFPTAATRARLHSMDPNALFNGDYKQQWQKVLGA